MSSSVKLVAELAKLGIKLQLKQGKLSVDAPQGVMTADLLAQLKQHKTALMSYLQPGSAIVATDRHGPLKLSFSQQRLWLLDQFEGPSNNYTIPAVLKLSGKLNINALQRAFNTIVARHESLRTVFVKPINQDEPEQIIRPAVVIAIPLLTDLPAAIAAQAAFTFDLTEDCMLQVQLVKLDDDEHVLLVNMHHIASDGWSLGLLINEFKQLYQQQTNPLTPLPIQYADYVQWQRNGIDALQPQLNYWTEQLADLPALHNLPLDKPRPAVQSFAGQTLHRQLDHSTLAQFNQLCQSVGATLFMGLHTVFSVLLARYSNDTDIVIGTPTANREQPEIAHLIGFFVNTLVLRHDLSANPCFSDCLKQSRQTLLDAYAHQQCPFELLVERLKVPRNLSHNPLFQVMLMWQDNPIDPLALPGLTLCELKQNSKIAKFDLTLSCNENGDLSWEYNTALFQQTTIERMAQHFCQLLSAFIDEPQQHVLSVPMLNDAEQRQWHQFNNTTVDFPDYIGFDRQATATPEAMALVCGAESLSYQTLQQRTNQLAHYLLTMKIGRGCRVGIQLPRSSALLIAVLGVMKSGASYVALDPALPRSRLDYLITDAQIDLVLADSKLMTAASLSAYSDSQPDVVISAQSIAYLLYTSGSTGLPKGVVITHSGLANYLSHAARHYFTDSTTRSIVSSPLSFDATITTLLTPLLLGRCVEILPESDDILSALAAALTHHIPTLFKLTPAHLTGLQYLINTPIKTPHVLVIGGEQLSRPLLRSSQTLLPNATFINEYGPTETVVGCSTYTIKPGEQLAGEDAVPIGQPIQNTQLYVIGVGDQLQPQQGIGELLIAGAGVAQGYWQQDQLTAERFTPHPFTKDKVYRSGDLVRLRDGQLEYLGRIDQQLKIRGFRIEPSEIEHQLRCHEQVDEVVVLADDDTLIAYVVGNETLHQPLLELLRLHLPAYMIPSALVFLPEMPLTANGKIHRQALLALAYQQTHYVAPVNETEKILCDIWQQVLELEQVGTGDNFFTLGGHSLLALRVVTQLSERLKLNVPLKLLFDHQCIAAMAAQLSELTPEQVINPVSRQGDLATSFAQQRLWLLDQIEGGSAHYNMPAALKLSGQLHLNALTNALSTIVARHESLRTVFVKGADAQPLQQILPATPCEVPLLDLSQNQQQLSAEIQQHASMIFDLSAEPMLRVKLLKLATTEHVLLFNIHHIASDGWSMALLLREFVVLYRAYLQRQANPLPPLPIQYADYAHWQRQQGATLARQLDYWQSQLFALPVVHDLPLDFARPAQQSFNGNSVEFLCSAASSTKLTQLCRSAGATLFIGLHAAFSVLLARRSNATDIVIGSPIANREQGAVVDLIGFFVNMLVLRSDLSANPTFIELLAQSKRVLLGAYSHQQLPFEHLVDHLQPQRSRSFTPLFQVVLALQNIDQSELTLPDLQCSIIEPTAVPAKYDLTLNITETAQGLVLNWQYNSDLFNHSTITTMASDFDRLLTSLLDDPQQTVLKDTPLPKPTFLSRDILATDNLPTKYIAPSTETERILCDIWQQLLKVERVGISDNFFALGGQSLTATRMSLQILLELDIDIPIKMLFDCQTVAEVAAKLATLGAGSERPTLTPISREAELVCSFAQQRLWLLDQIDGSSVHYNIPAALKLTGKLNITALQQAFSTIIERHESLRTVFLKGHDDEPKQQISAAEPIAVPLLDLSDNPKLLPDEIARHAGFAFDLALDSLLQIKLLKLGSDQHVLLFNLHHIAADAWSMTILINEFSALYSAYRQGESDPLIPLPIQYADYAAWQRRWLQGEVLAQQLRYWRQQLANLPTLHSLPLDKPRPAIQTFNGATYDNLIDDNRSEQLKQLCRSLGVTLFMGLHGLFSVLLARYSHSTDIVIGSPVANREQAEVAELIGFFVNTLVLRSDLSANPHFVALLSQNKQTLLDAYAHQQLPFEQLVEHLQPQRNLSHSPLFQVMLSLQNDDESQLSLPDITVEPINGINTVAKFDLSLAVNDSKAGLQLNWTYNTELFESATMVKMANDFIQLLKTFTTNPRTRVWPAVNHQPNPQNKPVPNATLKSAKRIYVAPTTAREKQLCAIWQQVLGLQRIGIEDDFFAIGGHSIMAVKLISQINRQMNSDMSVATIFTHRRIATLALQVEQQGLNRRLIKSLTPDTSAKPLLFMVHPAGGGAEMYQNLAEALSSQFNCIGIDNFNLVSRQKISNLPQLGKIYVDLLLANYSPQLPIKLLGWSFGGNIALEMAWQLEQKGYHQIEVYLLDTMITNEQLKLTFTPEELLIMRNETAIKLAREGFDTETADNIIAAYRSEMTLDNDLLSGALTHTTVALLKAGKAATTNAKYRARFEQMILLKDNNVSEFIGAEAANKLTIHRAEQHSHDNILEAVDAIQRLLGW